MACSCLGSLTSPRHTKVHTQLSFACRHYLRNADLHRFVRTAPSILAKESRKDGSSGSDSPGSLVINSLPTKEESTAIQLLPSYLGEPVAVIHYSHLDPLLMQLPLLLLAGPFRLRGLPLLLANDDTLIGSYTAAPSKQVQTPNRWANAMITAF